MRRKILDGQQFGEWTVIQYAGDRKQLCRCSCGNIQVVDTSSLKSGRSKHCSDKTKHILDNKDKSFKDLTGQQFGVLTVIEYVGESRWKCRCVGGTEKMFKYFLDKYNPNNVITYVNIAKFNGNSYTKLGFKAFTDVITKPNYVWVDGHNNVLKRYMTMKSKLIKQGIGTIEETEDEIMIRNNYFKIYDSGNLKLVYIKEEC